MLVMRDLVRIYHFLLVCCSHVWPFDLTQHIRYQSKFPLLIFPNLRVCDSPRLLPLSPGTTLDDDDAFAVLFSVLVLSVSAWKNLLPESSFANTYVAAIERKLNFREKKLK